MTRFDTLLVAAWDLVNAGNVTFAKTQLAVAAWVRDPKRFGMAGFKGVYPSDHRMAAELADPHESNPLRCGYLERVAPGFYRLTEDGFDRGTWLAKRAAEAPAATA